MRKLMVASFVSLDGVVEAPVTCTGWYYDDCKEWNTPPKTERSRPLPARPHHSRNVFCALVLVKDGKYIERINGLKKLVASRTLKEVNWNASLTAGDLAAELAEVKRGPSRSIMKYGVGALDRTLVANKLVDEYQLWILPTRVAKGTGLPGC